MPRRARIKAANKIYSVVTRVNNSEFTFADYSLCEAFLTQLKRTKDIFAFKLFGFVIMSSHIHLLIQPDDEIGDISEIMCHLNGKFAQKFNRKFKRKGHFWMQRFSSKLVQDGKHIANTIIYFALNPVKAGIVDNPLKHKYSSILSFINKNKFDSLLDALPEELQKIIQAFLAEKNFLELIDRCQRTLKRYSFTLKKTKLEQRFRHFIGSTTFVKECSGLSFQSI
jgi:putative transposase